jgi:diguanylate cyclase (GGDEF)-like protein/PAS domain S-box-containing protein
VSSSDPIHVLLVASDENDFLLTRTLLSAVSNQRYDLEWASSHDAALRFFDDGAADVVLLEAQRVLGLSAELRARACSAPVILLAGIDTCQQDIAKLDASVVDLLLKDDVTAERLHRSIQLALGRAGTAESHIPSDQALQYALDALPTAIAILNEYGSVIQSNAGWRRLAVEAGLIGSFDGAGPDYLELCEHSESRDAFGGERVARAIRAALEGELDDVAFEYSWSGDWGQRWNAVAIARVFSHGPTRLIITYDDVTRRLTIERELRALGETMDALVLSSPAAIIGLDMDSKVTSWNLAAERILGWTEDEVIGRIHPIVRPEDWHDFLALHDRVMLGEVVLGAQLVRFRKDGSPVSLVASVGAVVGPNGEPAGSLAIMIDITSRVRAEQELTRREQQFRALVENSPDLIVRYDRQLRRLYGNPAANAYISFRDDQSKDANLRDVGLAPHLTAEWERHFRGVFEDGQSRNVDWHVATPAGKQYFDSRLIPEPGTAGSPDSILVITRNITERMRRDEERHLLAEATRAMFSSLDLDATLKAIVEQIVPDFADTCSLSLFDDDGVPIRRVAVAHADRGSLEKVRSIFDSYAVSPDLPHGVAEVFRTGEAALYEDVEAWHIDNSLKHSKLHAAVSELGMTSAMFVPLNVRDVAIGALTFVYGESERHYTQADLEFAKEIAERASVAIDNARLHRELLSGEARFRTLVEQIPAVLYATSADDLTSPTYFSPQIVTLLGYPSESMVGPGSNWYEVVHPDDRAMLARSDRASIESGHFREVDYRLITRDGRVIWVHDEAILIRNEQGQPRNWQGILSDVTMQKELESQLTHQAFHDTLTGLPNRALFLDRVNHAQNRNDEFGPLMAVCFMDLDNFKVINDSLGHTVGDALLVAVAERLASCLRKVDTAARLGGDEFAILLENLDGPEQAQQIVQCVLSAFDEPVSIDGRDLFITPSIGISVSAHSGGQDRDLLREADAAMYKAKRAGKARFELYTPALSVGAVDRFELENDLRRALSGNQFIVHYQPIVDTASAAPIGVEALVRWIHPVHGLIPPDRFIPIAEENGMIRQLGLWVLNEACGQIRAWNAERAERQALRLSVNLSARQFSDSALVDDVRSIIRSTGIEPALLCLEITESVMMEDEDAAAETLRRLKKLGIRLAVDDFGVGHSSLGALRRFPVDQLKIDRSFVDGLIDDARDSVIVSGVIGMAHALNLAVVAEGVETEEQRNQLVELGCEYAQGYFFSRPLPASEIEGRVVPL